MQISSMIIKTRPGRAPAVLERLHYYPELTTYGIHRGNNLIVVAETVSIGQLERLTDEISRTIEDIWAITPTYLNFEEETQMAEQT